MHPVTRLGPDITRDPDRALRVGVVQLEMPSGTVGAYRNGGERDGAEDLADGFKKEGGVAWGEKRGVSAEFESG